MVEDNEGICSRMPHFRDGDGVLGLLLLPLHAHSPALYHTPQALPSISQPFVTQITGNKMSSRAETHSSRARAVLRAGRGLPVGCEDWALLAPRNIKAQSPSF